MGHIVILKNGFLDFHQEYPPLSLGENEGAGAGTLVPTVSQQKTQEAWCLPGLQSKIKIKKKLTDETRSKHGRYIF